MQFKVLVYSQYMGTDVEDESDKQSSQRGLYSVFVFCSNETLGILLHENARGKKTKEQERWCYTFFFFLCYHFKFVFLCFSSFKLFFIRKLLTQWQFYVYFSQQVDVRYSISFWVWIKTDSSWPGSIACLPSSLVADSSDSDKLGTQC